MVAAFMCTKVLWYRLFGGLSFIVTAFWGLKIYVSGFSGAKVIW
jgi:hypothetical protein